MKKKIKIELHLIYVVETIGEIPKGTLRKGILLIDENTPLQDFQDVYDNGFIKVRLATLPEFLYWSSQKQNPCSYAGFKDWRRSQLN